MATFRSVPVSTRVIALC